MTVLDPYFPDEYFWVGNTVPWNYQRDTNADDNDSLSNPTESTNLDSRGMAEYRMMQMSEIMGDGEYSDQVGPLPATEASADQNQCNGVFRFLDLPFEIRLQIYHWVHLLNHVRPPQLTPWYPKPADGSYFVKIVYPDLQVATNAWDTARLPTEHAQNPIRHSRRGNEEATSLLSPHRPIASIPSALLRANKHIYWECRAVPFQENEFVFVNWFASGLWAALSFTKSLEPWQQEQMRHVRLELLSRDLTGTYAEEWRELCQRWSVSLRSLRLKILSGGGAFGSWVADDLPRNGAPVVEVRDCRGNLQHWVEHGLRLFKELRILEVELVVADWDNEMKIRWCEELQEALNEKTDKRTMRVVCVERQD